MVVRVMRSGMRRPPGGYECFTPLNAKEAIGLGAVDHIAPLSMIFSHILMFSHRGKPVGN